MKKNIYPFIVLCVCLLLSSVVGFAQSGCTDPAATNYVPGAYINDGSCTYPSTHHNPGFKFKLPAAIEESSGVVWSNGRLWTHNDGGNTNAFYNIDTTDGHILQTVFVDGQTNTDWEDMTADSLYIYIADCGNNNGNRTDLKILKIAKADIAGTAAPHVTAQVISFNYADQLTFATNPLTNFDCEAIISRGDSLYLFTKNRGDAKTRVYKVPKTPGSYSLTYYTSFNVAGMITGADYNAAKKEVMLIGYVGNAQYSFFWFLNDFNGDMFFSGNKRRVEISSAQNWQTEAVCYMSNKRFFISCEKSGNIDASVYTDTFSWTVPPHPNRVRGGDALDNISIFPNPTKEVININNLSGPATYVLKDMWGREVKRGRLNAGNNVVSIKIYPPATYTIFVQGDKNEWVIKKIRKD